ncbi:cytochrome c oxidase accessory protein CcoG [Leeia sp. TBRC 13508]|uniref:Cytochrome c oxidase accessory protein CcoG n=1 Tax=Leeia speluncae TaxID=2884804 RepID=A0ABS8D932_9NEIS|nr:cytochrome c oxidase accessory protein CcoG [Leeia speluncae]MCB6184732.1 cytochrome c oxidase accessory protein CcoG [Leeia speluncae]
MSKSFKNIPIKTATTDASDDLYEVRKKIQVRSVSGMFATYRWLLVWITQIVFYGLPWLTWGDRPAVLFDLTTRKFFLFGLILWPQDLIYLALLLMVSAFGLFWWTTIAGRLWCGYACPQTVYTEIFMWIEEKIEGSHLARQKLDNGNWTSNKLLRRGGKHAAWILFSLWTGFTFVAYFTPIATLFKESTTFAFGPWETFWIFFYGLATYGNAGFLREQVCKYMCPYARFQSAMFDRDTLIISYDAERGDPRGSRKKSADPKELGLGSCIDCGICVQVCPTGIDIRNGLQYECIGCAACIDACDQVMEKMNYPKGLIRYTTENALEHKYSEKKSILEIIIRPRVILYTAILFVLVAAMIGTLAVRNPLKADVLRDRNTLVRETADGLENVYSLIIINTDEKDHQYNVSVDGIDGIKLASDTKLPVAMASGSTLKFPVRVIADPEKAKPGTYDIHFKIEAVDTPTLSRVEKSTFIAR